MNSTLTTTSRHHLAEGNALDVADAAFNHLVTGPAPLTVDGATIGHDLPARDIDLMELRSILLNRSTGLAARDVAWAELVRRSRSDGEAWTIGCVGVAMPGLKAIAARATRHVSASHADDVVSELLTEFIAQLASIDIDRHSIAPRLLWSARKAALRAKRRETIDTPVEPEQISARSQHEAGGHVDLVLADAVRQCIIDVVEAELITITRLERTPLSDYARDLGVPARKLYRMREAAEARLVAAIRDGKVSAKSSGQMRNLGE